jgi:uncharacterized protein (TIGR02646 family)
MRKFNRTAEPAICVKYSTKWNLQWVESRKTNPKTAFNWYSAEGKTAREHMLPTLREQSQGHCNFCDASPLEGVSDEPIEHFRPKSSFPDHAYTWSNLYYCCNACQKAKREQWDEKLLHADADDFSFSRYFEFDFTTGEIRPNPLSQQAEQERAAMTVKLYGLDSTARRRNRLDQARRFAKSQQDETSAELWAYRDFLGLDQ